MSGYYEGVFNEFPFGPGISLMELRDGNAECPKHGRCAFDPSPPCGCFPIERGGPVTEMEQPPTPKRKRAA